MNKKKLWIFIFLIGVFIISLLYRLRGLVSINPPFWVDEIFTASQANVVLQYGLNVFNNTKVYFEYHNITTHFLVALFFKIFGKSEWVARLPFVIIGSFVPVMAFIFSRFIFNLPTSIVSSILISFAYIEITWSRQARGYVLQQLLLLAAFYLYFKITSYKKNPVWRYLLLAFVLILGVLTHTMFYLIIASLLIHYLIFNFSKIKIFIKSIYLYIFLIAGGTLIYLSRIGDTIVYFYNSKTFFTNNLWYYHSFLWREYGLILFLAITGLLIGLKNKFKETSLIFIYLIMNLLFLSFIFKPYVSRYLLPIFPLLFILACYALTSIQKLFYDRHHIFIAFLISLFFIGSGYKFVNKPEQYYSVNHDFREIANIDYGQVYNIVKEKIAKNKLPVAIIETLPDRARWYLGYDYQPVYLFRWTDEIGSVNGLQKNTAYKYNLEGEKVLVQANSLKLIGNLSDLKKAIKKYDKGFIFIDDASLSKDIIDYAKNNFKKEIYLDHFTLDDNPYSIWPATLYSWGFK
ncbi:conserved membrane hypothetical protein [Candidatus Roizmanbacteria bacterium]|nr:conserved membrane hypothetical protein [Candidatus Roizmanbacteria bacterium]